MEYSSRNDFEESNKKNLITNKPFKNKELIQKKYQIKYNQRHSKIINLILFEITLIILSKINGAFGVTIQIKVNQVGDNQVISDNYEGTLPEIYYNNNNFVGVKIVNVGNINDIIQLRFGSNAYDLSYLFYNLENINFFNLSYVPETANNINITRMFYNCKNIETIVFDIIYNRFYFDYYSTVQLNKYYLPEDLSYAFYNCISLTNLQLYYFRTYRTKEIKYMFYNCKSLQRISFIDCSFSNYLIKNMRGIFENCESLTSINLTTFNTRPVKIMWGMFKNCKSLISLNLYDFHTEEVIDMESMFEGCENLISLNLTKFRTPNVHYMNKMFFGCTSLQSLDFNYINSDNLGTMDLMFYNCKNLKYLNLFSLTEKVQSIAEIFEGASDNFEFCIDNYEKIPNIYKEIFKKINAHSDCSTKCYKDGSKKPYNSYKRVCCPKFLYNDTCYDKCPPRTAANSSNICEDLNCPPTKYVNYAQNGCTLDINGYYENDTKLKTIDKCHENCRTCDRGPTNTKNYCTECKSNLYLYFDNCVLACPNNSYPIPGTRKCKCPIEECKECDDESLQKGLCKSCYNDYYPKFSENYGNYSKCYKNPPRYYLDRRNQIYMPCYPSCESCNSEGNDHFHHCTTCNSNYTVKLDDRNNNNCYENCTYYYYFDSDDIYRCTEKDECPNDFKYLIKELRKCVSSCSDTVYKKILSHRCYKECPLNISEPREGIPNSCRPLCTYEFPFELIPEEKCVANCSIMERSEKLCITNYFGNRSNLEIQELIRVDIERDLEIEFNYSIITENQTVLIEENQTNYEIVTTRNKNPNSNTTKINLGECEKVLKDFYDIPQDDYLYMLIIDAYVEGKTGPVTLYEVYYPLFNSKT